MFEKVQHITIKAGDVNISLINTAEKLTENRKKNLEANIGSANKNTYDDPVKIRKEINSRTFETAKKF